VTWKLTSYNDSETIKQLKQRKLKQRKPCPRLRKEEGPHPHQREAHLSQKRDNKNQKE
jgi:hypothetical protein